MDTTDQRLIAILRQDARTSVSALAHDLNLSRATVRARMERLHQNGTIRRFTVELDPVQEADLVRAVVMIRVEGSHTRSVIRAFARMPQIVAQYATNGVWDLVIDLECANLQDFDRALREVREVRGVTGSESSLLLRSLTDS